MASPLRIHAHFTVAGQKLPVSHFSLIEALSEVNELRISLEGGDPQAFLGQIVRLELEAEGGPSRIWHLRCEEAGQELVCRSAWAACFQTLPLYRMHTYTDFPSLIKGLLRAQALPSQYSHWALSGGPRPQDLRVQAHETDGAFLQRICGRENILFFSRHDEQGETLHFVDHPRFFTPSADPLIYRPEAFELICQLDYRGTRSLRLQTPRLDLTVGQQVEVLSDYGHSHVPGTYRLSRVIHEASRIEAGEGMLYQNRVLAEEARTPWQGIVRKAPPLPLVFQAEIVSSSVNEQGFECYGTETSTSIPVPRLSPYVHARGGFQCPLQAGTEVLVSCLQGDPDRPVILGAFSGEQVPVTHRNPYHHLLCTAGQHRLLMDDDPQAPSLSLSTKSGHQLILRDGESSGIVMHCQGGMIFSSQGTFQWTTAATLRVQAGEAQRVEAETGSLHLRSAHDFTLHAQRHGVIEAEQCHWKVDGDQRVLLQQGDAILQVQGVTRIETGKGIALISETGSIRLIQASGHSGLELTAAGEIRLWGKRLIFKGDLHQLQGKVHYRGFSLLETLIALFMLSLLSMTLMKHQVFLLQTQQAIEAKHRAH
jgi:hypothetical protein